MVAEELAGVSTAQVIPEDARETARPTSMNQRREAQTGVLQGAPRPVVRGCPRHFRASRSSTAALDETGHHLLALGTVRGAGPLEGAALAKKIRDE